MFIFQTYVMVEETAITENYTNVHPVSLRDAHLIVAVKPRSQEGRRNAPGRTGLGAAAGLGRARGHHEVEIEPVLLELVEVDNGDILRILRQFDLPPEG